MSDTSDRIAAMCEDCDTPRAETCVHSDGSECDVNEVLVGERCESCSRFRCGRDADDCLSDRDAAEGDRLYDLAKEG